MSKGFSIITNFGCKTGCSYCIWKQHSMYGKEFSQKKYIDAVDKFIRNDVTADKFSISGGGDPLNNFDKNELFWEHIINTCHDTNKKFDIHTSYDNWEDIKIYSRYINRMVLHSTPEKIFRQIDKIIEYDKTFLIRVNFVVTPNINISVLKLVEPILMNKGIQISYRELVSDDETPIPDEVVEFCSTIGRYVHGRYVKQEDYNIYLMPDGNKYDKFLF